MFGKIKMIILGNVYRFLGKNEALYNKRYVHCKACPHNSANKTDLNFFEKAWSVFGAFCTLCKCPLKAKLVEPNSECPILKWEYEKP